MRWEWTNRLLAVEDLRVLVKIGNTMRSCCTSSVVYTKSSSNLSSPNTTRAKVSQFPCVYFPFFNLVLFLILVPVVEELHSFKDDVHAHISCTFR